MTAFPSYARNVPMQGQGGPRNVNSVVGSAGPAPQTGSDAKMDELLTLLKELLQKQNSAPPGISGPTLMNPSSGPQMGYDPNYYRSPVTGMPNVDDSKFKNHGGNSMPDSTSASPWDARNKGSRQRQAIENNARRKSGEKVPRMQDPKMRERQPYNGPAQQAAIADYEAKTRDPAGYAKRKQFAQDRTNYQAEIAQRNMEEAQRQRLARKAQEQELQNMSNMYWNSLETTPPPGQQKFHMTENDRRIGEAVSPWNS